MEYRNLSIEDEPVVREFLVKYYTPRHVLFGYMGVTSETLKNSYMARIEPFLKQGNSFGAFDERGTLCGVLMNVEEDEKEKQNYENASTENEKKFVRITTQLEGGNLSQTLGTDKFWEQKFACISPNVAKSGVMKQMALRSYQLAKKKGIKKLIAYTSYDLENKVKSERTMLGYRIISKVIFSDFVDPVTGKKEFEGLKSPYSGISLLVCEVR